MKTIQIWKFKIELHHNILYTNVTFGYIKNPLQTKYVVVGYDKMNKNIYMGF